MTTNNDVERLLAHPDRVRPALEKALLKLPERQRAAMLQYCADGQLTGLDEHLQFLVGNLALNAVAAFTPGEEHPADPQAVPDLRFVRLLRSAQALLEARGDQMVTAVEWDRLNAACEEAQRSLERALIDERRGT